MNSQKKMRLVEFISNLYTFASSVRSNHYTLSFSHWWIIHISLVTSGIVNHILRILALGCRNWSQNSANNHVVLKFLIWKIILIIKHWMSIITHTPKRVRFMWLAINISLTMFTCLQLIHYIWNWGNYRLSLFFYFKNKRKVQE